MKTTKELRDTLTEKRTLYRESLARAEFAAEHVQEVLAGIDMDYVDKLAQTRGIDLQVIKTIDTEKLKTDPEYLNSVQTKLNAGILQLHSFIEESLDV